MSSFLTRRTVLGGLAGMSGLALTASLPPANARQATPPAVKTPLIVTPGRIDGLEGAIFRDYQWTTGDATPSAGATPALAGILITLSG